MATSLSGIYNKLQEHPQYLESILSIGYIPEECVDTSKLTLESAGGIRINVVNSFEGSIKKTVMDVSKYDGYPEVTESKLLMYPYSYIEVTAYNGDTLDLKLEHFDNQNIQVESWGYLNPDTRLAYVIKDYNKDTSLDTALIIKDFPQLPTASSTYEGYLARSKTSTALQLGLGAVGVVAGAFTGNLIAAGAGLQSISSTLAKQNDIQATPNAMQTQAGGSGFNIANDIKGFTVKKKMIKPEYQEILTQYWKAYGYKVNKIKTPNLKTRQHYNFVKTSAAAIRGNIPNDFLNKIKDMFNNGVTLWHGDYVGDYTKENNEI